MRWLSTFLLFFGLVLATPFSTKSDHDYFRIGTGGIGGTYYPIGGLLAQIISSPHGARPCGKGGNCGVPGLVAVAQSSNGSVANIEAVSSGRLESGFAQSDIIHWAYTASGVYEGKRPARNIRAIASLYPESLHIVVRRGAGIKDIYDLRGKRVSLDEAGSGTLVDARLVLSASGLSEKDLFPFFVSHAQAAESITAGTLDAIFIVAGHPAVSVADLADRGLIDLIAIPKAVADKLIAENSFFANEEIPAGVYSGIKATPTLSVDAQWITAADADEGRIYAITRALWHPAARKFLDNIHPKARSITLEGALNGLSIPLHPGAKRFYKEMGLIE